MTNLIGSRTSHLRNPKERKRNFYRSFHFSAFANPSQVSTEINKKDSSSPLSCNLLVQIVKQSFSTGYSPAVIMSQRASSCSFHLYRLHMFAFLMATIIVLIALDGSEAGPAPSYGRFFHTSEDNRINRRGFKSSLLSTARGFGKRSGEGTLPPMATTNNIDAPVTALGRGNVPTYQLAEEASANPRLLALLVNLLDVNGDGMISPSEVLREEIVY